MNKMGYSTMMYRNLVYKEYIDIELDMTKDYIQEFYRSVEKISCIKWTTYYCLYSNYER